MVPPSLIPLATVPCPPAVPEPATSNVVMVGAANASSVCAWAATGKPAARVIAAAAQNRPTRIIVLERRIAEFLIDSILLCLNCVFLRSFLPLQPPGASDPNQPLMVE